MEKISKETDLKLKLVALDIAAREMIDNIGSLDLDKLFDRSRAIYDRAHEDGIYEWKSPYRKNVVESTEKKEEPKVDEDQQKKISGVPDGLKQCPKCSELIPKTWIVHKFKKDGSECGHRFQ